ncbi:MAG TPA: hypothetical protein VF862_06160 [Gemmatimonadales bacterium]
MITLPSGWCRPHGLAVALMALAAASCGEPVSAPTVEAVAARGTSGSGPVVSSFTPADAPRQITIDLTVSGSGFDNGSTVRLEKSGAPVPNVTTNTTSFVSSKQLVASITISAEAVPDLYDVAVITTGGKRGIGAEQFQVMEMVFLGPLEGEWLMWGAAINAHGGIVGLGATRPFFWSPAGGPEWLDGAWGAEGGMNDLDQVVGVTCGWSHAVNPNCVTSNQYGVLWRRQGGSWEPTALTGRGGNAWDINNAGQIYGNDPGPTRWTITATGLTRETLPTPPDRPSVIVRRANNTGQAAGGDVVWSFDGSTVSFVILPPPAGGSKPGISDLSDRNAMGEMVVAGFATFSGYSQPVRWRLRQSGGAWLVVAAERLAAPFKSFQGWARGVNNHGDVVGSVYSMGGVEQAVRWPLSGAPVLLPQSRKRSYKCTAYAINDAGWVTGGVEGLYNGAVLWRAP